jgi:hypothetical protein
MCLRTSSKGLFHAVGRQRWQGRKPAACASLAERKKRTLARSGRLLAQPGRQKTPVVVTA